MITSSDFNRIRHLTFELINAYHSVNSVETQEAFYAQISDEMYQLSETLAPFIRDIKSPTLTKEGAEKLLASVKAEVVPFEFPTKAVIQKLFKKVKKLKVPEVGHLELRDYTYFAWNDLASHRKYMLVNYAGQMMGIYGTIGADTKKNTCAICSQTSQVVQFMALTKSNVDGTYTKNGNYICLDSDACNHQMQHERGLANFVSTVLPK